MFVASAIIHMVLRPWHANETWQLPNEAAVADALRGAPPGEYRMPYAATMNEMKTPAFEEKVKRGPLAIIGVYANVNVGRSMGFWFIYTLVAAWFAGHTAHRALPAGASDYLVFHTTAMTAFAAYGIGLAQASIWGPPVDDGVQGNARRARLFACDRCDLRLALADVVRRAASLLVGDTLRER